MGTFMYYADESHKIRKKNYTRYKKLTELGYSISDETAAAALYVINEDPFGRNYYKKSLGPIVTRDPISGEQYRQEDWATKEFIVDNKAQLIVKASADLLVGNGPDLRFEDWEKIKGEVSSEIGEIEYNERKEWLERLEERTKLKTKLYESAMRNSSQGDQYFELYVKNEKVNFRNIDPYFVRIVETGDGEIDGYEISWEIEVEEERKTIRRRTAKTIRKTYVKKKTHRAGSITYQLFFITDEGKLELVPYNTIPEHSEFVREAITDQFYETYIFNDDSGKQSLTRNQNLVYTIVGYTGIDAPLVIHWPNYKIFGSYGVSDIGIIESLQNALNSRETQLNDVLDKHTDPSMFGEDSYLDENGNLIMSNGGGRFFPVSPGGAEPGYLAWDSHLDEAQKEIDRLYKAICLNTEISPALLGVDESGVESGRALMYKLIRSLAMASRKEVYLKDAIVLLIKTAQKLDQMWVDNEPDLDAVMNPFNNEWGLLLEPVLELRSALPTDEDQIVERVVSLKEAGILSTEMAVTIISKIMEGMDVKTELDRIENDRLKDIDSKSSVNAAFYKTQGEQGPVERDAEN